MYTQEMRGKSGKDATPIGEPFVKYTNIAHELMLNFWSAPIAVFSLSWAWVQQTTFLLQKKDQEDRNERET